MIRVISICDKCIHQRPNIDGWKCACDAFPDGIPREHTKKKISELPECNNGINFEEKDHNYWF